MPIRTSLILLGVTAIWGANFTVMKLGLRDLSPLVFNTTRLMLAALIAWVLVYLLKTHRPMEKKDLRTAIILGILGFGLPQVGITLGVSLTSAGNCSIIMALIPVSVLIINRLAGQEITGRKMTVGVAVSLTGVILIVLGSGRGISISPADLKGIIIMLLAQFFCAYFTVFSRPLVDKYPPFQVMAWMLSVAAGFFILVSLPQLIAADWTKVSATGWLSVGYSGIFALALGNLIWGWGIRELGSTRISIFNNVTPVFAVLAGWLVLQESFGWLQFAGAAVIFAGLQVSQQAAREIYQQPIEDVF